MNQFTSEKPLRGRPRDPNVEDRVFSTVMKLYAEGGWSALTFEAVARASGVGKSPLYRRWDSREALLREALKSRWLPVHKIDTGTLRDDLKELAEMIFENRTGDLANLQNWFLIDATRYPEVQSVTSPYIEETVLQARAIVRRAVKRGEVPKSLNAGLLMDLVVGAVNNHVLTTPSHLRAEMIRKAPDFLDNLVEVVLQGVRAKSANPESCSAK